VDWDLWTVDWGCI